MGIQMQFRCLVVSSVFCIFSYYVIAAHLTSVNNQGYLSMSISVMASAASFLLAVVMLDIFRLKPADSHTPLTLFTQYITQTLLTWRGRLVHAQLVRSSADVIRRQERVLLDILQRNENTVFGHQHNFPKMATREDFVRGVPLTDYSHYEQYVRTIMDEVELQEGDHEEKNYFKSSSDDSEIGGGRKFGKRDFGGSCRCGNRCAKTGNSMEQDQISDRGGCALSNRCVLTADDVTYIATSSGTTGKNKLLPVTLFFKTLASRHMAPLLYYNMSRLSPLTLHRVLVLSYKSEESRSRSGRLRIGPISSYIGRRLPFSVSPSQVYELTNEQEALHIHAVFSLAEPELGRIEALLSSLVYSFWVHIEKHWPQICNEIEAGQLEPFTPAAAPLSSACSSEDETERHAALYASLRTHLTANKFRADQLRREFAAGFIGVAKRVWPRLSSVRMVTTGSFAHHAQLLDKIYMKTVMQVTTVHAASEGFYGINTPLTPGIAYAPLIDYGVFEFIPVEKVEEKQPKTVFPEKVLLGKSYELVYTSHTGLYRYRTGDVIRIVSFLNQSPLYEFEYRIGQILNLYWEKTPESVLHTAVINTINSLDGVQLMDYSATEDVFTTKHLGSARLKHYVLFIEISRNGLAYELTSEELKRFDRSLCEIFELYATFRQKESIGPMRVVQVKPGTFAQLNIFQTTSSQSSAAVRNTKTVSAEYKNSMTNGSKFSPSASCEQQKVVRVLRNDERKIDFLFSCSLSSDSSSSSSSSFNSTLLSS